VRPVEGLGVRRKIPTFEIPASCGFDVLDAAAVVDVVHAWAGRYSNAKSLAVLLDSNVFLCVGVELLDFPEVTVVAQ
jgi:hypothetical protein